MTSAERKDIGARALQARAFAEMSQEEAARHAGANSRIGVSNLERGRGIPGYLDDLARAYGVSPWWLRYGVVSADHPADADVVLAAKIRCLSASSRDLVATLVDGLKAQEESFWRGEYRSPLFQATVKRHKSLGETNPPSIGSDIRTSSPLGNASPHQASDLLE